MRSGANGSPGLTRCPLASVMAIRAIGSAPGFELFKDTRQFGDTVQLLKLTGAKCIGFEAHHISVADFSRLESIDGITWVPMDQPLEALRQVKSANEIAAISATIGASFAGRLGITATSGPWLKIVTPIPAPELSTRMRPSNS